MVYSTAHHHTPKGMPHQHQVLLTNEVIDFIKKIKRKCMVSKVDFKKAYDCVKRVFIGKNNSSHGVSGQMVEGWVRTSRWRSYMVGHGSPTKF